MVSFQCNGCGDILTKPKLDKHRATCRTSFDCIDCSKRFETPADYKGHTSCISEAEKYQKTSYNGRNTSGSGRGGGKERSWQQGGEEKWRSNRQRWQQQNVNKATGANGTPLGTPVRMSPVNDTSAIEGNAHNGQPEAEVPKKRKAETGATELRDAPERPKKKRKQKTVESTETTEDIAVEVKSRARPSPTAEANITQIPLQGPCSQALESQKEAGERKKTKKKKEQKPKKAKEDEKEVKNKGEERKKEKRKQKGPSLVGQEVESATVVDDNATSATPPPVAEAPPKANPGDARSAKKSRSKKLKSELGATCGVLDATASTTPKLTTTEVEGAAQNDRGSGKKKRRSGNRDEDDDEKLVAQGNNQSFKEKEKKKRKRKSEGQTASTSVG